MNKKILFAVAAAIALGLGGVASADTVSINGEDIFTSASIDFEPLTGEVTGTGVLAAFDCSSCAVLTGSNVTSSFSGTVFSATDSDNTISFSLDSGASFSEVTNNQGITTLTIAGSGELYWNGAPYSPANFVLTTQTPAYSFSAIITETPLPSTWTMLIASLLCLGLFVYRGSKKQSRGVSILGA